MNLDCFRFFCENVNKRVRCNTTFFLSSKSVTKNQTPRVHKNRKSKRPACASKRDVLELPALRYVSLPGRHNGKPF